MLNIDGGGGTLDEKTGKPEYFTWQGAEKTYADFELTVTNPGGHSSEPRKDNAINQLAAALVRIGNYQFKPELNDLTRAYFIQMARYEDPKTGAAMRAFAANPADKAAIAVLTANPAMVGKIGTTCVATMINGGHALNALPQRGPAPTSTAASSPATSRPRSWPSWPGSRPIRRSTSRTSPKARSPTTPRRCGRISSPR